MTIPDRAKRVLRSIRQAIPSGVVLGRRSPGSGPAEFIPLSEIASAQLDAISATRGSVLYRGASTWLALTPGTAGQFLQTNGANMDPSWAAAAGGGGPAGASAGAAAGSDARLAGAPSGSGSISCFQPASARPSHMYLRTMGSEYTTGAHFDEYIMEHSW